jgi:hypothetical protein
LDERIFTNRVGDGYFSKDEILETFEGMIPTEAIEEDWNRSR